MQQAALVIGVLAAMSLAIGHLLVTFRRVLAGEPGASLTILGNLVILVPMLFSMIYLNVQNFSGQCLSSGASSFFETSYFSYVTYTTLGYGDITPVSWCRPVAVVQAVLGYVSLAVVVAYLLKLKVKQTVS